MKTALTRGVLGLVLGLFVLLVQAGTMAHAALQAGPGSQRALRPGVLATWDCRMVGMQLKVPTERIDIPRGVPFRIKGSLWLGGREATEAERTAMVPQGAVLSGTFSGPGIAAQVVTGDLVNGVTLPAMNTEGDYVFSGVQLLSSGQVLLEAEPKVVNIHCLGDILISQVTSTPMTMDEIRGAGIELEPGSYEGRKFTLALTIGSELVNLTVPVATPIYMGPESLLQEPLIGRLEIGSLPGRGEVAASVVVVNLAGDPEDLFILDRPSLQFQLKHTFKALLIIPGNIGYLHQFYKANLVVLNTLAEDSPFQVTHLSSEIKLPVGQDGAVGTEDDPLRLVSGDGEGTDPIKPILGPDDNGNPGKGIATLKAGESGMATFFVEALKEGAHAIDFNFQGQFEGGELEAPVPLRGTAQGKILVRNPNFSLVLVHPDVVRKGEVYTLEAHLTNTSTSIANGVSISLDQARLGTVKLVGDATLRVDTLAPGAMHVFKFQLKALRNGEVRSSFLYVEGGSGSFMLTTGLGERSIRLNPDTLVLPKTLDGVPATLREAMLRVLGQAYSIASTKGGLPPGVLPISMSVVTGGFARDLSEQGLFLKMGVDRVRVWWNLWRLFTQNADPGFDQLMRTTQAGAELRRTFLDVWDWADPSRSVVDRFPEIAQWAQDSATYSLVTIRGGKSGLVLRGTDAEGNTLLVGTGYGDSLPMKGAAWGEAQGNHVLQMIQTMPGASIQLQNAGNETQRLDIGTSSPVNQGVPTLNRWSSLEIPVGGSVTLRLGASRGGQAQITRTDGSTSVVYPESVTDLQPEPFQVLAVHRYDLDLSPSAGPFGTQVMILFNRPNAALEIPSGASGYELIKSMIEVEANRPLSHTEKDPQTGADMIVADAPLVQAYPQAVSLYLKFPVGPYVERRLAMLAGWSDLQGNSLGGVRNWPILCGQIPGGALVRGKVRKTDGAGLPAQVNYYYYMNNSVWVNGPDGPEEWGIGEPFWGRIASELETGADGSFQFDYVPEPVKNAIGPFILEGVHAAGNAYNTASVFGNGQNIEMDLVQQGKGTVEGIVVDGNGQPMAEVVLQVFQNEEQCLLKQGSTSQTNSRITRTDAKGFYRFEGVLTGAFNLRALKGLYGVALVNEIPGDGAVVIQNIQLSGKTGTIKARLLDLNGQPMLKEYIRLGIPRGVIRQETASSWIYPIEGLPGGDGWVHFTDVPAGDVRIKASGFSEDTVAPWDGYLDPGGALTITLRKVDASGRALARIRVVDFTGQPVEGATVRNQYNQYLGISDESGRIPDHSVIANAWCVVWAEHPGWVEHGGGRYLPTAGETFEILVWMPAKSVVQGHVTRVDGTPLKGAYVAFPPVGDVVQFNRLAITDGQGYYRISNAPSSGVHRIAAVGPDLRTAANLAGVQTREGQTLTVDLAVPFPASNTIKGVVMQPAIGGQPAKPAMAHVWVTAKLPSVDATCVHPGGPGPNWNWGLQMEELLGSVDTGAEGSFTFKGLPAGEFIIHANSDFFPVIAKLPGTFGDALSAELTNQNITMINSFAAGITGTIYQKDGQSKVGKGIRVILNGKDTSELIVRTQEAGAYEIPGVVPAGDYTLRAEDPWTGTFAVTSIHIAEKTNLHKDLRLWGKGNLTVRLLDDQGNPIKEGVVSLRHSKVSPPLLADDLPEFKEKLTEAHQGRILFEDVLEGMVTATIVTPSGRKGISNVNIPEGGGDREVTVRLEPLGSLRGLLRRADGSLVTAGNVTVHTGNGWLGVSTTRQDGVDGRFRFEDLPVGTVQLEAWDPDTRQTGTAYATIKADTLTEVDIQTMDVGRIDVTVTREGSPVGRAAILATRISGGASTPSEDVIADANGQATLMLSPGEYLLQAVDQVSLSRGSLKVTRELNQAPIQVEIPLNPVRSLFVTVSAPQGAPAGFSMANWSLKALSVSRSIRLDASAQGLIRDLAIGNETLELRDELGHDRGRFSVQITADGATTQTLGIQAHALGSVAVTLLESDGTPQPDCIVSLGRHDSHVFYTLNTNLEGKVLFTNIPQAIYSVSGSSHDESRHVSDSLVLVSAEGAVVERTLRLEATASIEGTLRDAHGAAVPFTPIILNPSQNGYLKMVATDALGRFRVDGLLMGHYVLVCSVDGKLRNARAEVDLVSANVVMPAELVLNGLGTVKVRVLSPQGEGLPGQKVSWSSTGGSSYDPSRTTDASGDVTVSSVPAGSIRVSTTYADKGYEVSGVLASDGALDLTITILATTQINGQIKRASSLTWPEGTTAEFKTDPKTGNYWNRSYPMNMDGTIQDTHGDFTYVKTPILVQVKVPSGNAMAVGTIQLVPNAPTVVDLTAGSFGTIRGTVVNPDGTPAANVVIRLESSTLVECRSNAAGDWVLAGILPGTYHLLASGSKGYAMADPILPDVDGGSVSLNLRLLDNKVQLPVSFSDMHTGFSPTVSATGEINAGGSNQTKPILNVDNGTDTPLGPVSGIATWIEPNRQLNYLVTAGTIEVSVTHTVVPYGTSLREEIRFRNTDSLAHTVSFREDSSLYNLVGIPSDAPLEFPADVTGDIGIIGSYGCLLWGNGQHVPQRVESKGYDSGYVIRWPNWALEPGESRTLMIVHANYATSGTYFRKAGALKLLDRILHGAPEFEYLGERSSWSNWLAPVAPAAQALPPWNASVKFTLKDFLGRTVLNNFQMGFEPNEVLAQVIPSFYSQSKQQYLPPDGGNVSLTLPGQETPPVITRNLTQTADTDIQLDEAAPLLVEVRDAHGVVVPEVPVEVRGVPWRVSDQTGNTGEMGPLAVMPGTYQATATLLDSGGLVKASGQIAAAVLQDNRIQLRFPAVGAIRVNVVDIDGRPVSYFNGYIQQGTRNWNLQGASGFILWPRVEVGEWTVAVQDSRTYGWITQQVLVNPDETTVCSVRFNEPGKLKVNVLDPAGAAAGAGIRVSWAAPDGSGSSTSTNSLGVCSFTNVGLGLVRVTATNSGLCNSTWINVGAGASPEVTVQLGSGSVDTVFKDVSGRPLVGRYVRLRSDVTSELGAYTDAQGVASFASVPLNTPLNIRYSASYGKEFLYQSHGGQPISLSQNQEKRTLSFTQPVGRMEFTVLRSGTLPVTGVLVYLYEVGQTSSYPTMQMSTDAQGKALFPEVPLDSNWDVDAMLGGVKVSEKAYHYAGPDQVKVIAWPDLVSLTVRLRRTNGEVPPSPQGYSYWGYPRGWEWTISPGGEGGWQTNTIRQVTEATWSDVARGSEQMVTATMLMDRDYYWTPELQVGINPGWTASGTFKVDEATQTATIVLPTRASARLVLKDASGRPITSDLRSDYISMKVKSSTNPILVGQTIYWGDPNNMYTPQVFPVGSHVVTVSSQRWGNLGTATFQVTVLDDGKPVEVPLTVNWIQQSYRVKAVAGDQQTPVATWFELLFDQDSINLGSTENDQILSDSDVLEGTFWAPADRTVRIHSSYSQWGSWVENTVGPFPTNAPVEATVELPLTVTRARLTETDGTDAGTFVVETDRNGLTKLQQVSVAGTIYAVILGEEVGSVRTLTLYDPLSGLGKQASVTTLPVGQRADVLEALPPHGWVTSYTFTDNYENPVEVDQGHLALGGDIEGVLKPSAASWVYTPSESEVWKSSPAMLLAQEGAQEDWNNYDWSKQASGNRIRIPLQGTLWATGAFTPTAPFASQAYVITEEQELSPAFQEPIRIWVPVPFQVMGPDGVLGSARLSLKPIHAPVGWSFLCGEPDEYNIHLALLPENEAIRVETVDPCNYSDWWYGFLDLTVPIPVPSEPYVINATESRSCGCGSEGGPA